MSKVRVLVGTRKGAFVLTSDGKREKWDISGPHFAGWEIYHVKGSPADPNRLYASQSSGWFGQVIQRSEDGGATWVPVGNKFAYEGVTGTHQWYDGTAHPWEFKRVWHLEPSLTDPDTVYSLSVEILTMAMNRLGLLLHLQARAKPRQRSRAGAIKGFYPNSPASTLESRGWSCLKAVVLCPEKPIGPTLELPNASMTNSIVCREVIYNRTDLVLAGPIGSGLANQEAGLWRAMKTDQ